MKPFIYRQFEGEYLRVRVTKSKGRKKTRKSLSSDTIPKVVNEDVCEKGFPFYRCVKLGSDGRKCVSCCAGEWLNDF